MASIRGEISSFHKRNSRIFELPLKCLRWGINFARASSLNWYWYPLTGAGLPHLVSVGGEVGDRLLDGVLHLVPLLLVRIRHNLHSISSNWGQTPQSTTKCRLTNTENQFTSEKWIFQLNYVSHSVPGRRPVYNRNVLILRLRLFVLSSPCRAWPYPAGGWGRPSCCSPGRGRRRAGPRPLRRDGQWCSGAVRGGPTPNSVENSQTLGISDK